MPSGHGVHGAHDLLFRRVFSQPEHAAAELRHVLPAAVSAAIDWGSLQASDATFVADPLRETQADLLYAVRWHGREALLYVLLEHKSTSDPFTPLQLLGYVVRIWERWLEQHRQARKLPVVIPVVVHHSESGWTAAHSLHEMLDAEPSHLAPIAAFIPDFRLLIDDLAQVSAPALQARTMAALAKLALFCLQRARHSDDILAELRPWLAAIRAVVEAESGAAALASVLRYLLAVTTMTPADLRQLVREVGPKAQEVSMSIMEQLQAEGLAKGLAQGLAQGRAEGRAEVLLKQLSLRFGGVSPEVEARVRGATIPQLDRWAEQFVNARTLREVFAED